mgnify:FL=1
MSKKKRVKREFKKVYTLAQALADPRVEDCWSEFGNIDSDKKDWWMFLNEGYISEYMQGRSLHSQTLKQVLWDLNDGDVMSVETYEKAHGKREDY